MIAKLMEWINLVKSDDEYYAAREDFREAEERAGDSFRMIAIVVAFAFLALVVAVTSH